jgi:hypothetical protein
MNIFLTKDTSSNRKEGLKQTNDLSSLTRVLIIRILVKFETLVEIILEFTEICVDC